MPRVTNTLFSVSVPDTLLNSPTPCLPPIGNTLSLLVVSCDGMFNTCRDNPLVSNFVGGCTPVLPFTGEAQVHVSLNSQEWLVCRGYYPRVDAERLQKSISQIWGGIDAKSGSKLPEM